MRHRQHSHIIILILMLMLLTSCRALRPPESCGLGGFANETAYGLYFDNLNLLDVEGNPGSPDRDGVPRFEEGQTINLWLQIKTDTRVRICVEETRGGGEIAYDDIVSLKTGQSAVTFGALERGPYIIRLSIDGTLVKNFPFSVR